MLRALRLAEVDLANLEQREIAFAVLGRADFAGNSVTGAQVKATNLAGRHVNVIRPGKIGAVCAAQEAETVLQDFQHTITVNILSALGVSFEGGKNDVLFAGPGHVVQSHILGDIDKFLGGFGF